MTELDLAVARAEGMHIEAGSAWDEPDFFGERCRKTFEPSTNPAQGQPIMEREGISVVRDGAGEEKWYAYCEAGGKQMHWGPTMLIAAMRALVESKK